MEQRLKRISDHSKYSRTFKYFRLAKSKRDNEARIITNRVPSGYKLSRSLFCHSVNDTFAIFSPHDENGFVIAGALFDGEGNSSIFPSHKTLQLMNRVSRGAVDRDKAPLA